MDETQDFNGKELADVSDEEVTVFISEELAPSSFH
jgi:hypothetical protein